MKIFEVIREAKDKLLNVSDSPHLEAEILLSYVIRTNRESIIADFDKEIKSPIEKQFLSLVNKRASHFPLHYILGQKEFMGLSFEVNENVLIPRPETETLVEEALNVFSGSSVRVLDIGTGSGCILVSFLYYNEQSKGIGIDISTEAIEIAKKNALRHKVLNRAEFIVSDFMNYSSEEKFDLVLSNPPYVKTNELINVPYEPVIALDGGSNGYNLYPDLAKKIYMLLKPDGRAIVEIDYRFAYQAEEIFSCVGFRKLRFINDLTGKNRFIEGLK